MKTLTIHGSSDDLIYFQNVDTAKIDIEGYEDSNPMGSNKWAEFYPENGNESRFLICKQILVYVIYPEDTGIWRFSVSKVAENYPYPDWDIRLSIHENGYSMQVEIDIPNNIIIDVRQVSLNGSLILNETMFFNVIRDKHLQFIRKVKKYAMEVHFGKEYVDRWGRVLDTFREQIYYKKGRMLSTEASTYIDQDKRWIEVVEVLKDVEHMAEKYDIKL